MLIVKQLQNISINSDILNYFSIILAHIHLNMLKIIHCVPLQVGLQQVSGVLLVNNSSDDVRGLVMKSFITYDDVLALVSHSKTLVIASESRGPQREHLTKASLDTTAMNVWFFNLQLRIYM